MLPGGKIAADDLKLLVITDSVEEACKRILDCYNKECWDTKENSEAAKIQSELGAHTHPDLKPNGNGSSNGAVQAEAAEKTPARPEKGDAQ